MTTWTSLSVHSCSCKPLLDRSIVSSDDTEDGYASRDSQFCDQWSEGEWQGQVEEPAEEVEGEAEESGEAGAALYFVSMPPAAERVVYLDQWRPPSGNGLGREDGGF